MEFTSPSTDRSAIVYYRAGNSSSNFQHCDRLSVGSWQLSHGKLRVLLVLNALYFIALVFVGN